MDNKPGCGCGCGGKSKFRLVLFALGIIVVAAVGASQLFKGGDETETAAPVPDAVVNSSQEIAGEETEHKPFTLDPQRLNEAELIPVNIVSMNLAELGGETFRSIMLVPQAEWQGDFTADRVAATLLSKYQPNSAEADVVEIYLLPVPLESEAMLDEVMLGKLVVETEESPDSELLVLTRGYLPQELEFIKLWDEMWPEFMNEDGVDRSALTQAIIEKIGFDAYGMEYPFLDAERVENLAELLENYHK